MMSIELFQRPPNLCTILQQIRKLEHIFPQLLVPCRRRQHNMTMRKQDCINKKGFIAKQELFIRE